jgi:hypothetical protein
VTRKLSQAAFRLLCMERGESTIKFSLQAGSRPELSVTLRRLSLGWVADVAGVGAGPGVGRTARQALTAALLPLGDEMTRALLTDLGLLEPSIAVLVLERDARTA